MIIVQVKEGENIERALKKFKRKFEKTGIVKQLRSRQACLRSEAPLCRGIKYKPVEKKLFFSIFIWKNKKKSINS